MRYVHIPAATWRRELELAAEAEPASPINQAMAQHISTVGALVSARARAMVEPDPAALTTVLDHAPTTFADFVQQNLPRFADSTACSRLRH
ncbi:hypothetical protein MBOU_54390 [Mycobacterium bourgelatii]|uniref:Uncharacterized protein n=1 Tax=Mycobacterium bourgelatii TaxID=1273442 RepID=A0A7I9YY00_MYCBU|nr:hypothetical protein MBOU_54390 [Mycobacterium bourgelatii]